MRLICISDLHGKSDKIRELKQVPGDLIIIAGDITNFGNKERAKEILNEIIKIKRTLAVPGNCDRPDVNDALVEIGIDLHAKGRKIDDIGFFGIGGSGVTPFDTPQEYSEEDLLNFLHAGHEEVIAQKIKVMVSHSPPHNTKVDQTSSGIHAGSKAVRRFIEEHQPNLVLCGHIHEAKGEDKIGDTLIVNIGPLHMGYATVDINKKIKVNFGKL